MTDKAKPNGKPKESARGKIKSNNSPKIIGETDNARKIKSLCLEKFAKTRIIVRQRLVIIAEQINSRKI